MPVSIAGTLSALSSRLFPAPKKVTGSATSLAARKRIAKVAAPAGRKPDKRAPVPVTRSTSRITVLWQRLRSRIDGSRGSGALAYDQSIVLLDKPLPVNSHALPFKLDGHLGGNGSSRPEGPTRAPGEANALAEKLVRVEVELAAQQARSVTLADAERRAAATLEVSRTECHRWRCHAERLQVELAAAVRELALARQDSGRVVGGLVADLDRVQQDFAQVEAELAAWVADAERRLDAGIAEPSASRR